MRLFTRLLAAAVVLPLLTLAVHHPCFAQSTSASQNFDSVQTPSAANQRPLDKLELFALFAAGPVAPYAKQVIQKRGCTFAPDPAFLAAFPVAGFQEILKNIKPRTSQQPSPDRDAAYELLLPALEATHSRQFAVSDENYKKALKLAPDSATLHLAYGANFLLVPDGAKAEPEARRALELWPEYAEGHEILCLALMLQGKVAEAATEAREVLRVFPEHKPAKIQLAISLARNKQCDQAIPALRNALAVAPHFPGLHKFLGICQLQAKQADSAISELTIYTQEEPTDHEGHYFLGMALRLAGHEAEAASEFQRASPLKPPEVQ